MYVGREVQSKQINKNKQEKVVYNVKDISVKEKTTKKDFFKLKESFFTFTKKLKKLQKG